MPQPLPRVSHLVEKFGASTVVDDLSFSPEAGECPGLIGPNGAGKTTPIFALGTSRAPTMLLAMPLKAAVDLVWPLALGTPPTEMLRPAAILAVDAVVGYCVALVLTRRGFFK